MTATPLTILPSDWRFEDSAEPGDPACLCSRCHEPIKENELPIRMWPVTKGCSHIGGHEYRFHPRCLGMETFDEPEEEAVH